jgi:hypothetical protein
MNSKLEKIILKTAMHSQPISFDGRPVPLSVDSITLQIQMLIESRPRWFSRYSDSLRVDISGIESNWVARISVQLQTGPGAHLVSYKIGTRSLSRASS